MVRLLERYNRKSQVFTLTAFMVGVLVGASLCYLALSMFSSADSLVDAQAKETLKPALPVHISAPDVGIEAVFEEPLIVDEAGEMTVPKGFDTVAWYQYSPTPGEMGPAVVVGHVDSVDGPEVFHPLKDIKEGNKIEIKREDDTLAIFVVYEVDYYSQNRFPSGKVFGNTNRPELRLITCAGIFDKSVNQYSHNLVVYAYLVEVKEINGV